VAPGLLLHPVDKVLLEGHYERVRNRDSVANDSDRWYGRISFTPSPDKTVTLAYRRYEFDENLGDDDIAGLLLARDARPVLRKEEGTRSILFERAQHGEPRRP